MGNELTTQKAKTNIAIGGHGIQLTNIDEMMRFCNLIQQAGMTPKSYKSPQQLFLGIQAGLEIGLLPMQSMAGIMVVNNLATVWGDVAIGLVRRSPECEYVREEYDEAKKVATCRCKRRGQDCESVGTFSYDEAKQAGLLAKDTYQKYLRRMLQVRARGFAIRDCFGDLLRGLKLTEEVIDYDVDPTPTIDPGDDAPETTVDSLLDAMDEAEAEPPQESDAGWEPSAEEAEAIRQREIQEAGELF